ncbi:MAG: WGR domain-containing protein [Spirochaetia bacterium]|nr:WGR domain-containing protein [Spirochaetia bacterium]
MNEQILINLIQLEQTMTELEREYNLTREDLERFERERRNKMEKEIEEIKKYLIQQEGSSNKFWQIETDNCRQTVKWGKIGTHGRAAEKEFPDTESCKNDSEKLINQKLKKGYTEIIGDKIPEKEPLTEEEQAELFFWDVISRSNKWKKTHWSEYDIEEHLENIAGILEKKSKEQLIQFERQLQINLHKLYTAQIAELSIILECKFTKEGETVIYDASLSDDGFIYFRCWLLLKGKEFFDEITKDINIFINGKYSFNIGDTWAEGLLYVTDNAYSANHENKDESEIRDAVYEMADVMNYDSTERVMERMPLGGADLQKAYPGLVADIVSIR